MTHHDLRFRKFPNWQVTFWHCHTFNSGQVPLLPHPLFCLCIDVDLLFLFESTTVTVSQSGCASPSRVEHLHDGVTSVPLKRIRCSSAAQHVSGLLAPHNNKKAAQIYVGGRSSSLTVMLVEVVCSPFWGVYIIEGENGERILIKHDCQVFWCSQLMLKSFDLTRFLALAVSFWVCLRFSTKPPFYVAFFWPCLHNCRSNWGILNMLKQIF